MTGSRSILPLLVVAGLAACTCRGGPAPVLVAVAPSQAHTDVFAVLSVRGENFRSRVTVDFDSPGGSVVDSTFGLWLVAGTTRVPLTDVVLVSETELSASYQALSAAPGTYDVELLDPLGNRALLPQGFVVAASKCAGQADGTPCDDGSACTQGETCQAGKCQNPTSVVICTPSDPCVAHIACYPATGLCRENLKEDGSACTDGNACTLTASCLAGVCTRTALVSCAPPPECALPGSCDPASQTCQYPPAPDGTACTPVAPCTAGATCLAGACTCVNTAPLASFTVTPTSGAAGATTFAFDASASSDAEDPASALRIDFDFDGSGAWAPADAGGRTTHAYAAAGTYAALARVTDTGGLRGYAGRLVAAADPASLVLVTTPFDESDAGATPVDPKGNGFSLREAIAWVNLTATPAAIAFERPFPIALGSPLPALTSTGASILGLGGVVVDCSAVSQRCLALQGASQKVVGLEISGGPGVSLELDGAGFTVADCRITGGAAKASTGILATAGGTIGPGNDVSGSATGVQVSLGTPVPSAVPDIVVEGNRIHANSGIGLLLSRVTLAIIQSNVVDSNGGSGIEVSSTGGVLRFNTVDGNGGDGLAPGAQVSIDLRDNLFTHNGGYGTGGPPSSFSPFGHNGFFGNGLGPIGGGAPGPTDVTADPRYVDRAGGDFRLLPGSPAVDAGVDVGLDVNGPEPGGYNQVAPDLGAFESPY